MATESIDFSANPSLKQLVYDNLRARIISGSLVPGARLLEGELSEQLNISRAPIREAFNMLERDGFTTIIPRKGAVVSEYTKEDIYYIWELRSLIEPHAAKTVVHKIPQEEIDKLNKDFNKVMKTPENTELYMASDLTLHELFSKYQENNFLKSTLENAKAHSLRMRWAVEKENPKKQIPIVIAATQEHIGILQAINERDENLVCERVAAHVKNSSHRIINAKYGSEE